MPLNYLVRVLWFEGSTSNSSLSSSGRDNGLSNKGKRQHSATALNRYAESPIMSIRYSLYLFTFATVLLCPNIHETRKRWRV